MGTASRKILAEALLPHPQARDLRILQTYLASDPAGFRAKNKHIIGAIKAAVNFQYCLVFNERLQCLRAILFNCGLPLAIAKDGDLQAILRFVVRDPRHRICQVRHVSAQTLDTAPVPSTLQVPDLDDRTMLRLWEFRGLGL